MDPNKALEDVRDIIARIEDTDDVLPTFELAEQLAEIVGGLDEWLSRGGFLPDDWRRWVEA